VRQEGVSDMRRQIIGILTLICLLLLIPTLAEVPPGPHIQGKSDQYGWEIDVQGSRGIFRADGEEWLIEFYHETPGLGKFLYVMSFLGRKQDNFINLDVYVNENGHYFVIFFYNYKANILRDDEFHGSYDIVRMHADPTYPTYRESYVPVGKVPDYEGQDFIISSEYAEITPVSGRISYEKLQLQVYPVYNIIVWPPYWSEFWAIGINPTGDHAYLLLLYSNSSHSWVINLWNGKVEALPLGQAIITGDKISVKRQIILGSGNLTY